MNDTQRKGKTTELQCQLWFIQHGYNVYIPISEDSRADLIVNINNVLYRIQVKTCRLNQSNTGITFSCSSMRMNHSQGNIKIPYDEKDVDFFMTYYENKCYLIPLEICGKGEKVLCFNKSRSTISLMEDYEAEKVLLLLEKNEFKPLIDMSRKVSGIKVKAFNKDTKEEIAEYESFCEAARKIGKPDGASHIQQAARGQRKTAYGYIWRITE